MCVCVKIKVIYISKCLICMSNLNLSLNKSKLRINKIESFIKRFRR